jgi:hypothetical protein
MNKRIKEILEKSGLQPYYDDQQGHIEKFAELLIKECATIASKAENNDNEFRCMSDVIVEHFEY